LFQLKRIVVWIGFAVGLDVVGFVVGLDVVGVDVVGFAVGLDVVVVLVKYDLNVYLRYDVNN
jgi:hypothetical protein